MVLYARDIVEKEFLSLPGETDVASAARMMAEKRRGFTLVGSGHAPEGIVTEWDIVEKVVAEGKNPSEVKLKDIMSGDLHTVKSSEGIATVAQMMSEKGVRRLLVKEDGEIIGVITAKTVLSRLNEYVDKVSAQVSKMQPPWY